MKPFVLSVTTRRRFDTAYEAWEFMLATGVPGMSSLVEAHVELYREDEDE